MTRTITGFLPTGAPDFVYLPIRVPDRVREIAVSYSYDKPAVAAGTPGNSCDIGIFDDCFRVDSAMPCYKQVEQIYAAAGAGDRLWLDLHTGQHGWGGNQAPAFFGKYLGA